MNLVFRRFAETDLPPAEELHVRPRLPEDKGRRDLAKLVLHKGLTGLVLGEGDTKTIVVNWDPTLDDLLAAEFARRLLAGEALPAGSKAFAEYAAQVREGLLPSQVPLEVSLEGIFQAIRNLHGEDLTDPQIAAKFAADWQKMADVIWHAASHGINPFAVSLFESGIDFARARTYLRNDRHVYRDDVQRGERWLVRLPGGPPESLAFVLHQPKSLLFKYWSRQGNPPAEDVFSFLAVDWGPGDWVFSTDPLKRLSLKPLADRLQAAEAAHDSPRAAGNPWFDGKPLGHTLVAAPHGGSALKDEQISRIVKQWAGARPVARRRSDWKVYAAAAPVLAVGILIGLALVRAERPQSPTTPAGSRVAARVNGEQVARGLVRLDESESHPVSSLELEIVPRRGGNEVTFDLERFINQRVNIWVSWSPPPAGGVSHISVKVNDDDARELACQPGDQGSLESARHPALLLAKTESTGNRDNHVRISFSADTAATQPAVVRLHWQADQDKKRDLVLLAVGVSEYEGKTSRLPCAIADAREIVRAFQDQKQLLLFQDVLVNPELSEGAALNIQATRDSLFDLLAWVRNTAIGNSNSIVIVTLSGHGVKAENDRFFFCPHGFVQEKQAGQTAFSWEDFRQYLYGLPCPVIIIMDTCHSGVIGVRSAQFDAEQELKKAVDAAWKELAGANSGVVLIAACRGDQGAHENPAWQHGALTLAVLEMVCGEKLFDGGKKNSKVQPYQNKPVVTLEDVERYAKDRVRELVGEKQAVEVKHSDGVYLRDIPFAARRLEASHAAARQE